MEEKTTIYLRVKDEGWRAFKLSDKTELADRGITIGDRATIGNGAMIDDCAKIGYRATIGYRAKIGYRATIGYRAKIGYYAKIGYRAKIGDGAKICNGAMIGDDATICSRAIIGDYAKIGYRAKIGDGATICNGAMIGDYAKIGYRATIGDCAEIGDDAKICKTLFITGSRETVNYYGLDIIHIGCDVMTISEWRTELSKIKEQHDYKPEQIEEYKGYIEMIASLHESWNIEPKKKVEQSEDITTNTPTL